MSSDVLLVLSSIFGTIWRLFTSWRLPGFSFTPAAWAMFSAFFLLLIRFVRRLFGSTDVVDRPDLPPLQSNAPRLGSGR